MAYSVAGAFGGIVKRQLEPIKRSQEQMYDELKSINRRLESIEKLVGIKQ